MNQLPVRSKGAVGRAFAMFAGARALNCTPGSAGGVALSVAGAAAGAGAGAVPHAETAMLAAVTIATAIRLKLELMMAMCLRNLSRYFESGVPRRAGRSVSSRPSARISFRKMPAGSPVRTGLTITVTLSPGLMMFDFQPARIR